MELTSRPAALHGDPRALVGPMLAVECALAVALVLMAGMPNALFVLAVVALLAAGCALAAALRPAAGGAPVRQGRRQLGLLVGLACACFVSASGDWVHALWSVQFPLLGLCLGAGSLLVQVWPRDREPMGRPRWNPAGLALAGLALLCALPVLLAALPVETRPVSREGAGVIAALVDAARFGFGGEVPASMLRPEDAAPAFQRLGVPSRDVTVAMGTSFLAAWLWIPFAALAFAGRAIRPAAWRRRFLLLAPAVLALALFPVVASVFESAVWRNEPWLVKAYGPTLLIALLAALALFAALRRDALSAR